MSKGEVVLFMKRKLDPVCLRENSGSRFNRDVSEKLFSNLGERKACVSAMNIAFDLVCYKTIHSSSAILA